MYKSESFNNIESIKGGLCKSSNVNSKLAKTFLADHCFHLADNLVTIHKKTFQKQRMEALKLTLK